MGKTALTWEALRQLEAERQLFRRFPDGVIFFSFYGRPQAALALEYIALSYDAEPRPTLQGDAGRFCRLFQSTDTTRKRPRALRWMRCVPTC